MAIPASYTTYWEKFWTRYNQVLTIVRGMNVESSAGAAYWRNKITAVSNIWANELWLDVFTNRNYVQSLVSNIVGLIDVNTGYLSQTLFIWLDNFKTIFDSRLEAGFVKIQQAVDKVNTYYQSQVDLLASTLADATQHLYDYIDNDINQVYLDIESITGDLEADIFDAQRAAEEKAANLVSQVYTFYDKEIQDLWDYIDQQIGIITGQIDQKVGVNKDYVDDQVATVRADLTADIDTLEGLVSVEFASVFVDMQNLEDKLNSKLDLGLTHLGNEINSRIALVNEAIQGVTDTIVQQYNTITEERNQALDTLRQEVQANMLTLATNLSTDIQHVQDDFESQMAVTSELALYSYQYALYGFGLPEIGFLSLMNRTDSQFKHYKPFLKFVLARILEAGKPLPPEGL